MKPSRELAPRKPDLTAVARPVDPLPASYNYGVDPSAQHEVHLIDYWRAIRKRLWLVVGLVALITMLALLYVARKPDYFEAQARVQINLEDTGGLTNNTRPLYGPADDPIYFNTQLQILSSPGLMRRGAHSGPRTQSRFLQGQPGAATLNVANAAKNGRTQQQAAGQW